MAINFFAAIDVGSYELEMKIYEISKRHGIEEIDSVRHIIELGKDTYAYRKINFEKIDELCDVLADFKKIMEEYRVDNYRACATSALREAQNCQSIVDRIRMRTGINVEILSNSEQRFLTYKAVALKENEFNKIIEKPATIVEVGAGSMQMSIFDKSTLITTQNVRIGSLRVREIFNRLDYSNANFNNILEEYVDNDMETLKKMFIKDKEITNMIATGDYVGYIVKKANKGPGNDYIESEEFMNKYRNLSRMSNEEISEKLDIPVEYSSLILPCAMIYKKIIELTGVKKIWLPGVSLCEGIAAEYAQQQKIVTFSHDFNEDIIAAARNIAKRYMCNKSHTYSLENNVIAIFDSMKKYHGLGRRERLLLEIAAILHDCGKFISITAPAQSSYDIIISTEIIGLSHAERKLIAYIAKYNTVEFGFDDAYDMGISTDAYLTLVKLTAILRVANALDRSHKQKFKDIRPYLSGKELVITTKVMDDITLEQGLFKDKADFFEEVYGIRPVLKKKRGL